MSPFERRVRAKEQQTAEQWDKGHGRLEHRRLTRTTMLNGYLDWPGAQQVFRVERTRTLKGRITTEVAYGITSMKRTEADAETLLELNRGHWGIENRLFYVRDMTFGEDACRVRRGASPRVLAATRNLVQALMQRTGWTNKAAACRHYAAQAQKAARLVLAPPEN